MCAAISHLPPLLSIKKIKTQRDTHRAIPTKKKLKNKRYGFFFNILKKGKMMGGHKNGAHATPWPIVNGWLCLYLWWIQYWVFGARRLLVLLFTWRMSSYLAYKRGVTEIRIDQQLALLVLRANKRGERRWRRLSERFFFFKFSFWNWKTSCTCPPLLSCRNRRRGWTTLERERDKSAILSAILRIFRGVVVFKKRKTLIQPGRHTSWRGWGGRRRRRRRFFSICRSLLVSAVRCILRMGICRPLSSHAAATTAAPVAYSRGFPTAVRGVKRSGGIQVTLKSDQFSSVLVL